MPFYYSNDVVSMQDELSEDEGEEEESDSREDEADAHEAFEDSSSEGEDAADILSRATEDKEKSSFESRQEKVILSESNIFYLEFQMVQNSLNTV